jgi:hypothetical protein
MESETETEKRVREYWASAYKNKNKDSIYNISSLDFAKMMMMNYHLSQLLY